MTVLLFTASLVTAGGTSASPALAVPPDAQRSAPIVALSGASSPDPSDPSALTHAKARFARWPRKCKMELVVGHVPGTMTTVWVFRCVKSGHNT